jgi:hypothetical protein
MHGTNIKPVNVVLDSVQELLDSVQELLLKKDNTNSKPEKDKRALRGQNAHSFNLEASGTH